MFTLRNILLAFVSLMLFACASASSEGDLSLTPSERERPKRTANPDELVAPKRDGVYLVGVEIAAGEWRSLGIGGEVCWWVRRKYDGIIFDSYYGPPGVSMRVEPFDYEVEMEGCGVWEYVGP